MPSIKIPMSSRNQESPQPDLSSPLARFRMNKSIARGELAPEATGELDIGPFDDWELLWEQMAEEDQDD